MCVQPLPELDTDYRLCTWNLLHSPSRLLLHDETRLTFHLGKVLHPRLGCGVEAEQHGGNAAHHRVAHHPRNPAASRTMWDNRPLTLAKSKWLEDSMKLLVSASLRVRDAAQVQCVRECSTVFAA